MNDIFALNQKKIVFLVGVPRSGTTWLQRLLSAHPDIATAQESHLFNHMIAPMMAAWQHLIHFNDGRGGIGAPAYVTQAQFNQSLCQFVYDTLAQCPRFQHGSVFIEKTPDHLVHIELIKTLIPSARFIYMQRNPNDVIESLLAASQSWGRAWAPRNVFKAIRLYKNYRRLGERQLENVNQDDQLRLHYEALKRAPSNELRIILDFLSLPHSPVLIEKMVQAPPPLEAFGEFAARNGAQVQDPKDFHRKKKNELTWFQKAMIQIFLPAHSQ